MPRDSKTVWYRRLRPVRLLIAVAFVTLPAVFHFASMGWHGLAVRVAAGCASTAALCFFYAGYVRVIERRPTVELSWPGALRELGAGAGIGGGMMSLTIATLALVGAYHVVGVGPPRVLVQGIFTQLPQSLFEEILFRAILFRICEEALGSRIALAIQAALFGALHLLNPHANLAGALAIALTAGIVLAAAFLLTRRLWLAWGIHFAWNFTQGFVFGGEISGSGATHGLLVSELVGPRWLTGGSFGVELSVVAFIVCMLVAIALLRSAARRGQIIRGYG